MEVLIIIIVCAFVIFLVARNSNKTSRSRRKPLESRIKPPVIGAQEQQPSSQPHKAPETESIEDYNEAIRLDPDDANAYYNRGWDYDELGEYEKAIEDYSQVIRLDPNHTNAYNNRGLSYANLGQNERAMEDFNEAIRLDPNHTNAYNNRGNVYYSLGEYEKALQNYDEAIRLDPGDELAIKNRKLALAKMN